MTKFKLLITSLYIALFISLVGCDSIKESSSNIDIKIKQKCPQCNMKLPESNIYTCNIDNDGHIHYFDDVGCMVLWTKENNINLKNVNAKIYSKDTKKYIDAFKAFYKINEKTPMLYGFSAYENKNENCINFDEVIIRMLRGEHMANPKIRKQVLGY